jgi:hypothetical protein
MKRCAGGPGLIFLSVVLFAAALAGCAPLAASDASRLLVKPRVGLNLQQFDEVLRQHGARRVGVIEKIGVHIVELSPGADAPSVAALMSADPRIEFAEVDKRAPPSAQ